MSTATLLARADAVATRNHLVVSFGGARRAAIAVVVGLAALVAYNLFTFTATSALLGSIASSPSASALVLPLLPVVLALPAYGMALVIWMLLPVESPLVLQARLLGASRWYCGVSRFLPIALLVAGLATVGLIGSFGFVATLAPDPVAAMGALMALAVVAALVCTVLAQAVERIVAVLRGSPREARLTGVVVAALGLIGLLVDVLHWATTAGSPQGPSLVTGLMALWRPGMPDSWWQIAAIAGIGLVLVAAGCALAMGDPAAGYLRAGSVSLQTPPTRSFWGQQVVVELATALREPTSRVSLAAMLTLVAAIVVAARAGAIDPGALLLLLALISATGGELVVGRSLPLNWLLRAWGVTIDGVLGLRLGVTTGLLTAVFTVGFVASGLAAVEPQRILEAYSLFFAILSLACLAGTLIPFDERAPLGMLATSVLSIGLEFGVVVVVTTVLRLQGLGLVAADVVVVVTAVLMMRAAFRRLSGRGV